MPASAARSRLVRVCVEATAKRAFASAVDWPGWSRVARDEASALAALAAHAPRYALVASAAGLAFNPRQYSVIERIPGNATTDFGAPDRPAEVEREPLSAADTRRMVSLVAAAWTVLDGAAATAPPSLRKGPRGGGRDRDAIIEHVLNAERAYARKLGVSLPAPRPGEAKAMAGMRTAILEALSSARTATVSGERGWLPRYAARRIAWHAVDHAWEIEDRIEA